MSGRKLLNEQRKRFTGCAAKLVDRLIGITYSKNIRLWSGEKREQFHLGKVRVLELIYEQKASMDALLLEQWRIVLQQLIGTSNHVAEGAEVPSQHVFHGGKDVRDFPAALQYLVVRQLTVFFGARNARQGNFLAFEPFHVTLIIFWPDEFVLAPAYELEQAVEKLADISGANKMFEM